MAEHPELELEAALLLLALSYLTPRELARCVRAVQAYLRARPDSPLAAHLEARQGRDYGRIARLSGRRGAIRELAGLRDG